MRLNEQHVLQVYAGPKMPFERLGSLETLMTVSALSSSFVRTAGEKDRGLFHSDRICRVHNLQKYF